MMMGRNPTSRCYVRPKYIKLYCLHYADSVATLAYPFPPIREEPMLCRLYPRWKAHPLATRWRRVMRLLLGHRVSRTFHGYQHQFSSERALARSGPQQFTLRLPVS